ncbi:phage tail tape measure protein [Pseudomonas sp. UMC65]|uniref:phage tail tape measure protein n=1 Tax=Pseudomonas sp. UMC65 TaxID=1862323 RepID=UPI00160056A3|nr:phage tail tape measure protein [Pseudomonas sp. UMC65]MBB1617105.1 phage tail tape measure protein [Pseudomonas sp. UMC65]
MTTIAELGIKVDSEDAVQASSNLDQMAAAGARVEKTTEALGETFDQARTRLLQLGKEAVAAKEAQAGLANVATGLSEAQQGLISSTSAAAQAQAQVAAAQRATVVSTDSLATSSTRASAAANAQQAELRALLEQIDPATRALNRLDEQERRLAQHKKLGLDQEVFTTYQTKIQQAREAVTRFDDSLTRTGNTAKQTAAALRGVPAQFTDIFVSLQGGQAPLTVLLQQGGQLKDMFGGIGPAARAMGGYILGLVNPYTLAAAAVGALALAYYQGSKEQDAFRLSLVTTGNAAGTTTTALAAMAQRVSSAVGTTGEAAAALAQLAGTGKIASSSFEDIAAAAVSYEKATGRAVSETIAEFVKLADDPVKAVAELNNKYNFLTASVYEQVRAAQEMGEKDAAASIAQEALARALSERAATMKANLGTLERAWNDLAGAAKNGWDAILGIGRESSSGPDVKAIQQKINYLRSTLDTAYEDDDARDRIKSLQAELDAFQKKSKAEQDAADATANAARVQRDGQAAYEGFQKSLEQNFTKRQKMNKALEDEEKRISAARAAGYAITAEQEAAALKSIRKNSIYKEADPKKPRQYAESAGTKTLDQARQRYAVLQQQNVLIGAQRGEMQKLGEAGQALVRWEQQLSEIKDKKTLTADQKSLLANQELITTQLKKNAALEREMELRKLAADEAQKLAAFQTNVNSQLQRASVGLSSNLAGAGMGDVERQRMQERLSIEQQYQQQMDNLEQQHNEGKISQSLYEKETDVLQQALNKRLVMQEKYYQDVDAQQQDWSLGARSAFASYLEQARDVAGQTRALFTNAFGSMEDAIVQFAMTGKFSFADFTKSILADMARIAARQAASSALSSLFGMAASAAASYFGGPASAGSTQAGYTGVDFSGYRAAGGPVAPNSMYEVNELGPELYNEGGRSFLMTGANGGSVTPLTSGAVAGAAGANGGGASGSMIQVNAPVSLTMQDRSSEGMQLDQQALQQNMQKQMLAAAQKAVDDSWRPGGTSYMKARGRG